MMITYFSSLMGTLLHLRQGAHRFAKQKIGIAIKRVGFAICPSQGLIDCYLFRQIVTRIAIIALTWNLHLRSKWHLSQLSGDVPGG